MSGRIDTHHHVVPPQYAAWLRRNEQLAGGLPIPEWELDRALEAMDTLGVRASVLSVSTPGVHLGDGADARPMARDVNDFAAAVVRDRPQQFGFFATLPLPDVDGALDEISRAFDELGADGVVLLANHRGVYLGDPAFDPVFDELQRRRSVVFVHPSVPPGLAPVPGIAPFFVDFLLDTTRAALNLARSGTLERCADVRIVLAHAGGFLPYAAARMAIGADPSGNHRAGMDLLRRFWFDTALSSSEVALPSLLAFAAPGRVTFGSDWPYAPGPIGRRFADELERYDLDPTTRGSIDHGAASELFPRLTVGPGLSGSS